MDTKAQLTKKYGADCYHLHCCFSGNDSSNNQSKVVEIVARRNTEELKFVCQTYRALYNQDLKHLLSQKTNLSARVVYLRISEPHDRDAEILRRALFGKSVEHNMVTEIICTRSSLELKTVKEAYRSRYNSDLKENVSCKHSGILKEILLAVLASTTHSSARVDTSMAMCDSKTLYEAIASGRFVDERSIISILSQRSTSQMKAILSSFKQLYGHEFMKFLKKDNCGEFGKHLRVVIRCIQSPTKQFAKQLRRALKSGDAIEVLIRTVVTRAGIDIREINGVFRVKMGWSLESLIRNEFSCSDDSVSGFVGDVLIALLKYS